MPSPQSARSKSRSWKGLRFLLLTALAFSGAVSTVMFVLDFTDSIDLKDAKYRGKQSVKRGNTAAEGVSPDNLQGENILASILGGVLALACTSGLYRVGRSRRILQKTKLILAGIGIGLGMSLILPLRLFLRWFVRLII